MSTKGRLLVVDDNEMNRDTLSRQLERAGYEVATAAEGIQALEMIDAQKFDLLLLDIMMPGLTGIELLKILRSDHPATELPIIMATARDKSENMVEALSLGANDYVTKPLDFPVVLARIEAHLKMKNAAAKAAAAAPPPPPAPARLTGAVDSGSVIAGKYQLETRIGSGAFGAVFKAKHLALDNHVAIKVLQSSVVPTQEALGRFRREGVSACRIQHPNAVSILDFGVTEDGIAYLAMELLTGRSLADEVKSAGQMPPARCAELLRPILDVLGEAHTAGIVHRDIKPGNVFLHDGRSGEVVKVLDFGIAKLLDDSGGAELTVEGTLVGTPAYMAPERLAGQSYDGRSDLYSVGIMLYEMLCGQPPFKSPDLMAVAVMQMTQQPRPPRGLNPRISTALEALVMEALSKDPEKRPTSAAFAERLRLLAKEPYVAPPVPAPTGDATASPTPTRLPAPRPPAASLAQAPAPSSMPRPRPPRPQPPAPAAEEPRSWWQKLFGR